MNYMWEALLRGYDLGIAEEDIRFVPSKTANPYREVFFDDMNAGLTAPGPVDVNAYYRYGAVFGPLLDEEMDGSPGMRDTLFDILAHYLTRLDLRQGLCRAEYYAKFLREDIWNGVFGKQNARRLPFFAGPQARLVLAALLRMYKVGASMKLFASLLRELYPNSIAYFDTEYGRELLLYIGQKETPELRGRLELLRDLFIPADYDVKLFWDMHFGLIGTDETMEIGQFMMF
ncbi:MAG: hypothetical protein LBD49_01050 [Oscillospiraceae bacterium]|jgi:hypothetical protein|nr:hypothetical protein [Oscillospiraceae bacterium]